jgi:hypothetical protein
MAREETFGIVATTELLPHVLEFRYDDRLRAGRYRIIAGMVLRFHSIPL